MAFFGAKVRTQDLSKGSRFGGHGMEFMEYNIIKHLNHYRIIIEKSEQRIIIKISLYNK